MVRILVSSNCQTAGIAASLRALSGVEEVYAVPLGGPPELLRAELERYIDRTDLWILSSGNNVAKELARDVAPRLKTLSVPAIGFAAFQPDMCYARHVQTKILTIHHYNSAIVVWAYSRGLDVPETVRLFRRETFHALGYLDAWNTSVQTLRKNFEHSDLANRFQDFFLRIKRGGCFMHSINHPKVAVLSHLARIIMEVAGMGQSRYLADGDINDGLNDVIWPVYPEVAYELGLEGGSYTWKFHAGSVISGVADYVAQAFSSYAGQGIDRHSIEIAFQPTERIDLALGALTGR